MPASAHRRVIAAIDACTVRCHGVVLEDYGKGLLSPRTLRKVMQRFAAAGLPVSVDPKSDISACRGATLVKPNLREAEELTGIQMRKPEDLERIGDRLRRRIAGADVIVTQGSEGMTLFEGSAPGVHVHTPRREVFDVQGAGDTTIAALTLALRAGGTLLEAAVIANAAAGVVVAKVGTATASPDEVRAQLPAAIAAAKEGV